MLEAYPTSQKYYLIMHNGTESLCIMIQFSHCPTMEPAQTLCIMSICIIYEIVYCTNLLYKYI